MAAEEIERIKNVEKGRLTCKAVSPFFDLPAIGKPAGIRVCRVWGKSLPSMPRT